MKTVYPPLEHLKRKLSFAEAEAESQGQAEELGLIVSPIWLQRWGTFKMQFLEGDELWYWEYFPGRMTGGAGYCILRNGVSVASIAKMRA
jgi:hypothetical protein